MEYVALVMVWGTLSGGQPELVNMNSRSQGHNIIKDSNEQISSKRFDVRNVSSQKN